MPPRAIAASFWRGGTSRGLIFRAASLAPFPQHVRERIILQALGSPDPSGRQISGLGGGVSSLSKACILGLPGEGLEDQREFGALPGPAWAEEGRRGNAEWDVIYRFAQVGVREPVLDWTATCGNMLSAIACYSISSVIPRATLSARAKALPQPSANEPLILPISVFSAANGQVLKVRVPVDPKTLNVWSPPLGKGIKIAGVPEEAAPIDCEMPLEAEEDGENKGGLITGDVTNSVLIDGKKITASLFTAGLPNIFLPITELASFDSSITTDLLPAPSATLTNHSTLSTLLERIRIAFAGTYSIPLSLASPKIVLIGPIPSSGYTSSAGAEVIPPEADLLVRSVSSGDFHATIPGTTLGALNIALGYAGSTVNALVPTQNSVQDGIIEVRAAHAAGVADAKVRFGEGKPKSVVMTRTAREIMRGEVLVKESVFL